MKCFFLAFVSLLTGCAQHEIQRTANYSAPVASKVTAPVQAVRVAAERANREIVALESHVDPTGSKALKALKESLMDASQSSAEAQQGLVSYLGDVSSQTQLLNDAVSQKNQALTERDEWEGKQELALKKLWFWRMVVLIELGSVVVYLGLRTGWKFLL